MFLQVLALGNVVILDSRVRCASPGYPFFYFMFFFFRFSNLRESA